MLNHETDVIGNSWNAKKKKKLSSVIIQNSFSLMWHCHYSESVFSEAKNCLGDTGRNSNLIPKIFVTQPKFFLTFFTS